MEMMSRFSFQKKTFAPQYWMAEEVTLLTAKMETAKWYYFWSFTFCTKLCFTKDVWTCL